VVDDDLIVNQVVGSVQKKARCKNPERMRLRTASDHGTEHKGEGDRRLRHENRPGALDRGEKDIDEGNDGQNRAVVASRIGLAARTGNPDDDAR